jgi:hypothetical protein
VTVVRTVRASLALTVDRLDASFHASPGEAAAARVVATGRPIARVGDIATVWTPSRFARVWAADNEPSVPYLRPYDTFDYLPVAAEHLSRVRTENLDALMIQRDDVLVTCSGRNLGPPVLADDTLARFALSHDMVRLRIDDTAMRLWLFAYLRMPTGQALLRRGKAGSVVDHITVQDVTRVPIPLPEDDERDGVAALVDQAAALRASARGTLLSCLERLALASPAELARGSRRAAWTMRLTSLTDRLDAARYHPAVVAAAQRAADLNGPRIAEMAAAVLPVRYRRFYVKAGHGRAILSGRQLLQADPVNLRYVADRSFRDPAAYEVHTDTVIFGAVGRADGRVGQAALICGDRDGWLASNDVMRLVPHPGIHPGALWLAIAAPESQIQIKSLSFGSVIDHMNPWDVEALRVPPVDDEMAGTVLSAWRSFADAAGLLEQASATIERGL